MATMKNKVIWQEGLFALPQHFQQQQRHCEYLLTRRLDALGDFFLGFYGTLHQYRTACPGQNHD
ncbi:putative type VI secretion system protein [Escherichia coli]|nr:putative type VI secretion system protein [Escherichia coli]